MLTTADKRLDGRQRHRGVMALVRTVQRDEEVVIVTAQAAYGELLAADRELTAQDAELVALKGRRRADLLCSRDKDLRDLGLLQPADQHGTGLDDASLLCRDALQRRPQEPLMVNRDRRHHSDLGVNDVGGIP